MNALSTAAQELARTAGFLGLRPAAAALHGLVRLVFAVWVTIAAPQGGDAFRVIATELMLATGGGRALVLVAGVPTVVVTIADKDGCHALSITALEIFGGACLFI